MSAPSIAGAGVYVPHLRIDTEAYGDAGERFYPPGIRETAVPHADEDAVTMAYEAGTRALRAAGTEAGHVDRLLLATTTPPLEEEDVTVTLAAMLETPADTRLRLLTGSTAVGVQALDEALRAGHDGERCLVVASDCPRGEPASEREQAAGAGAAAVLVTTDGGVERTGGDEYSEPYPGTRFRRLGDDSVDSIGIAQYERDAAVEAIESTLDGFDWSPDPDAVVLPAPDGKVPYRIAGAVGVDTQAVREHATVHTLGDTGAAGPLLDIADALADGARRLLVVGYGSGARAIAFELAGSDPVPVDRADDTDRFLTYPEYVRMRGHVGVEEPAGGGAYVSVPSWRRTLDTRFSRRAGRCPHCEAVNAPAEGACRECARLIDYEPVSLSERGVVEAVTTISEDGAPPEFAPLQSRAGAYDTAIVRFEAPGGGSASLPAFLTDTQTGTVAVDDEVRTTIRRIYTQEGVTRYGHKVVLC